MPQLCKVEAKNQQETKPSAIESNKILNYIENFSTSHVEQEKFIILQFS